MSIAAIVSLYDSQFAASANYGNTADLASPHLTTQGPLTWRILMPGWNGWTSGGIMQRLQCQIFPEEDTMGSTLPSLPFRDSAICVVALL